MSKWNKISIGEFIDFNPSESIKKGTIARKIPMDKLGTFQRKINGSELSEYSSGPKFRNGDTLVAKITPCLENGKTALVDILNDKEVAFGSSEFIVLRENKNSDKKFIYYLSRSPLFRNKAISCMEGTSGRKRVNEGALKTQEILVPDLPTQQKIASVLSALDDKIELNNSINEELEAMAKTLYDYWFVQFDFPTHSHCEERGTRDEAIHNKKIASLHEVTLAKTGYKSSGGKMVYNETLKREIPEGWEVKTVGNILDKNKATNKINAKEYLNMGKIPVIDQSTNFICGFTNDESSLITTKEKPAIVFGDHTRILKLINFDFARGADGTQILFSKIENMPQFLLYYSLLKIDLSNYGYARHFKFLKEQNILIPKKEIAKEFNDLVKSYYVKIYNNLKQNQELSALRDWLLPMLMNGQVKVGMLD